MRDNGQAQTKVCSQTKGVQRVDVISEERILGKFFIREVGGSQLDLKLRSWQKTQGATEEITRGGGGR